MSNDILAYIIAAIATIISVISSLELFRSFSRKSKPEEAYSQKLARLSESLVKSSSEVDNVLAELAQVANEREKAVLNLEAELHELENREKQLKDRVQALENVPLPVAEHFAHLAAAGERKSARRDYMLFGAGVLVSTIIAIILKLTGLG